MFINSLEDFTSVTSKPLSNNWREFIEDFKLYQNSPIAEPKLGLLKHINDFYRNLYQFPASVLESDYKQIKESIQKQDKQMREASSGSNLALQNKFIDLSLLLENALILEFARYVFRRQSFHLLSATSRLWVPMYALQGEYKFRLNNKFNQKLGHNITRYYQKWSISSEFLGKFEHFFNHNKYFLTPTIQLLSSSKIGLNLMHGNVTVKYTIQEDFLARYLTLFDKKRSELFPLISENSKCLILPYCYPLKILRFKKHSFQKYSLELSVMASCDLDEVFFEKLENYEHIFAKLSYQLSFEKLLRKDCLCFPKEYIKKDEYNDNVDPILDTIPGFSMDVEVLQKRLQVTKLLYEGAIGAYEENEYRTALFNARKMLRTELLGYLRSLQNFDDFNRMTDYLKTVSSSVKTVYLNLEIDPVKLDSQKASQHKLFRVYIDLIIINNRDQMYTLFQNLDATFLQASRAHLELFFSSVQNIHNLFVYFANSQSLSSNEAASCNKLLAFLKLIPRVDNLFLNFCDNQYFELLTKGLLSGSRWLKVVRKLYLNLSYCQLEDDDLKLLFQLKRMENLGMITLELHGNNLTPQIYQVFEFLHSEFTSLKKLEVKCKVESLQGEFEKRKDGHYDRRDSLCFKL